MADAGTRLERGQQGRRNRKRPRVGNLQRDRTPSDVTVTQPDGSQTTQPPYGSQKRARIVAANKAEPDLRDAAKRWLDSRTGRR